MKHTIMARTGLGLIGLAFTACNSQGEPWFFGDSCHLEAYQQPAEWQCSSEVMAALHADEQAVEGARPAASSAVPDTLISHDSCEAGVASTRAVLKSAQTYDLRRKRVALLRDKCVAKTLHRTVGSCDGVSFAVADDGNAPQGPTDQSGGNINGEGASEYSTSNNQIAGVDEADFVKNDAEFVYTIRSGGDSARETRATDDASRSTSSNELVIFDVWPPEEAHEVARLALEGSGKKLHLEGDRLLVYTSLPRARADSGSGYDYGYSSSGECSYGYDCVPSGDGQATLITVYDVSDRAEPVVLRRLELSGSYINSRRIGETVYTVLHDAIPTVPGVQTELQQSFTSAEAAIARVDELMQENAVVLDEAPAAALLPGIDTGDEEGVGCGTIYEAPGGSAEGFLSVVSLRLDDASELGRTTVIGQPGFTYASADSLYVAVPRFDYGDYYASADQRDRTLIHKFELDGLDTRYTASGSVEGRVLNQFALDEHDRYLRVASTSGHLPSPDVHSQLSVLEQRDTQLVLVGEVDDIAPSEDIRSARFVGDRGYIVTFKKTDPLYVFDLATPTAPRIAGELKIPGFSTYLHPIDDGHLLSIGYDADDQGDFAWFQGIQLQVFDVSDMTTPRLLHKEVIGTRGSSSEALTEHLAFTYFGSKGWLALPITICENGGGGSYGDDMTFSGLYLYGVSLENGFERLGGVDYPPSGGYGEYSGACSNWWTNASSEVRRSIIMDDYVVSLSDRQLKISAAHELGKDVAALPIAQ